MTGAKNSDILLSGKALFLTKWIAPADFPYNSQAHQREATRLPLISREGVWKFMNALAEKRVVRNGLFIRDDLETRMASLDTARMPRHVAVICDGNGRWATGRGLPRPLGHRQGYQATRRIVRAASDLGLHALTLYAFSTENWSRPKLETDSLMRLFEEGAQRELNELHQNGVQMRFSGRLHQLPASLQARLKVNEEKTQHNTGLILNICLNYSGRADILDAVKNLVEQASRQELSATDVTPELFSAHLSTAGIPDPDLLIRTAGEMRVSNYLLWQIAYAELHVTNTLWPDFDKIHLVDALLDYQRRTRKFGGIISQ